MSAVHKNIWLLKSVYYIRLFNNADYILSIVSVHIEIFALEEAHSFFFFINYFYCTLLLKYSKCT